MGVTMIKVGIVGCGYWGSKHVRVFNELPGAQIAALCDSNSQRLEEVGRMYPLAFKTPDFDEMLSLDLDAVVIAAPANKHFPLAKKALLSDKHVLVEKPFTTNSIDAMELIDLANSRELTLMVGHTFLYNPAVRSLKELIQSGDLGQVRYIHSARLSFGVLQPDVDVLWDLAAHDISIILYLLGQDPVAVGARGIGCVDQAGCEVAHADLVFADSAHAHVYVSWLNPHKTRKVTVVASQGMVIYDDLANGEMLRIYDKEIRLASGNGSDDRPPPTYHSGDVRIPHIPDAEPLKEECAHFLKCIGNGKRSVSDASEGLRVVRILESLENSLSLGGALQYIGQEQGEGIGQRRGEPERGSTPVAPRLRG